MFDSVTLDQLRTLRLVASEGSFSGAARKSKRVQSAVSQAMANLERSLGVTLWDRSTRVPRLTEAGRAVLAAGERVMAEMDALGSLGRTLAEGTEASVGLVLDSLFPVDALVALCREFGAKFPHVELRVFTETMGDVVHRVREGACALAVAGPAASTEGLERKHLATVQMIPVAAASHPLARAARALSISDLAVHTQIVLSERGERTSGDVAVLGTRTWRIVDLSTKRALIAGGLGWGNLPEHVVRRDVARGKLVRLSIAAWRRDEHRLSLGLVHRPGLVMGPATSWVVARLGSLCSAELAPARKNKGRRQS